MWSRTILLSLISFYSIHCQILPDQSTKDPFQQEDKTDLVKTDQIMDNLLFAQFVSILGNFLHILLNHQDTTSAKFYATKIIEDVVVAAKIVTHTRGKHHQPESLKKIVIGALKYLSYMMEQQKKYSMQV